MKYPRILSAIRSARWCVTPATIHAIYDVLGAHVRGNFMAVIPDQPNPQPPGPPASGDVNSDSTMGVAVIEIRGIIGKHLSSMDIDCGGGYDIDRAEAELEMAILDPRVSSVVFDIDSPGGVVSGVPEMAEAIRRADGIKPCYAFTSVQCCSAAYWIASACRGIFCTKSADLGSIGVYVARCDDSEWWKKEGYKLDLIKAGEFKGMGHPGTSLTDAERALIQADVDTIYKMFTADVQTGRGGAVAGEVMQGQTFMGASAIAAGLADELVSGLSEVIAELTAQKGVTSP